MRTETLEGAIFDRSENLPHLAGFAHQRAQNAGFAQTPARHLQLDPGFALARGVGQDGAQACGVHRLLEKVVCAQLHGVHGQIDRAHCREHYDSQIRVEARVLRRQLGEQANAVKARHLQVGNHDGRIPSLRLLPALDAIARGFGTVSPPRDQLR